MSPHPPPHPVCLTVAVSFHQAGHTIKEVGPHTIITRKLFSLCVWTQMTKNYIDHVTVSRQHSDPSKGAAWKWR